MPLTSFHPTLRRWFEIRLGTPTPAQAQAWPAIAAGKHVLIAAPTGSGKTLAAFYAAIDGLVKLAAAGDLPDETRIVYVSPLKALSNDIRCNLEVPLREIEAALEKEGLPKASISVAVRTGDTASGERQKMLKNPPHILVTTPESLYLLLTSDGGRRMLKTARTLIVDEIHAVLADKRGAHLALSIERFEALTDTPLQRIGLSATQKPVELVAEFLVGRRGTKDGNAECVIVNTGHRRKLDLRIEVPKSPLSAVMSNEVWTELYDRVVELVASHRTTLIFVNTRRLAERLARALAQRIGEEHVSSHHGSMSKEHRHRAEKSLKEGKLRVLVATSSMELGIDIGSVELVVQFSSPKRIAAFLQRVGRSGHQVGGVSKGVLVPLSREDLVEAAALFDAVRRGELDRLEIPEAPLDVLAQQIVAEASSREWNEDALHALFANAYPYRNLGKERFLEIVRMLSDGFTTRRGRRGAYLHYDAVNGVVRARRGARLAALTNGGAIPDMFDYQVVLQPEGIVVGTLNEDFALESLAGDIFTLGSHSWQLIRIEGLKVFVQDAAGKPPTIPFWLGESAARSDELSFAVSRLRETVGAMLDEDPPARNENPDAPPVTLEGHRATRWLVGEVGVAPEAAEQLAAYLWMGRVGLGLMPTQKTLVMERFFDEAGDTHVVVHSPFGSRVNRAWGLALRKKFCRNFNFELQAAADENSIIFSLSSSHSFPLPDVFHYLNSGIARDTLVQAMLDAPLFEIRWRWNATRSLAILRNRNGTRVPPHLQRMQAEDLIAQVFPDQIACAENVGAERDVPAHPLVDQVVHDCLHEAMDVAGLEEILRKMERGDIETVARDLGEPSMFAQEIINARPYAFLDDVEFAQRRVNAIQNRGWLDPGEARELGRLDPAAIDRVKEEAWPEARSHDELHDALMTHGYVTEAEGLRAEWGGFFDALKKEGRATLLSKGTLRFWVATERVAFFEAVWPDASFAPRVRPPEPYRAVCGPEDALKEIVRGRVEALGPVTAASLAAGTELPETSLLHALIALENEGFVFRGSFTPGAGEEWCERRLLRRIHKYTIESLRESIRPVGVQDFMRFLLDRHRLSGEERPEGPEALKAVLERLEGFEAPAGAWESDLLPSRLAKYDPRWLDALCLSGKVVWGRFSPPKSGDEPKKSGPMRSTPIAIVGRAHRELWQGLGADEAKEPALGSSARQVRDYLAANGASFLEDVIAGAGLLKTQAEEGVAELVAGGLAVSDSFGGLRALLGPPKSASRPRRRRENPDALADSSRWSLVRFRSIDKEKPDYDALERAARVYLDRWGVLFRALADREAFSPPWRVLVRVLRRLELRGEVRGGRFVSQVSGEQFALPETVERLRAVAKRPLKEELVSVSAADPLNLLGVVLPDGRVPRLSSNRIAFRDGVPVAVIEGKKVRLLREMPSEEEWRVRKALVRSRPSGLWNAAAPVHTPGLSR